MRKILTILLCGLFMLTLTGCGSKESEKKEIDCIINPKSCEDKANNSNNERIPSFDDFLDDDDNYETYCFVDRETGIAKCEERLK